MVISRKVNFMKVKTISTYIALWVLLIGTIYFALTHGASSFSLTKLNNTDLNILINIRVPRIISAIVAGAALSVSGAFFQASLRNPIADPGIMGVSSAAGLFQTGAMLLLPGMFLAKISFAILGGFVAFLLLIQFQKKMDPYQLIIIGVALSAVFSGLQEIISSAHLSSQVLATSTWESTMYLSILSIVGIILAIVFQQWGNYLKVNDEELQSLGSSPEKMRIVLLMIAVLLASTVTACIGVIAFIGIIVPQVGRLLIGHDYQRIVPFSILAGGWFLLFVDTLGRTINPPNEISAAVLLAIIGGPVMIAILFKTVRRRNHA